MKERPILFSAPMVRALLAGTKTQTRRTLYTPMEDSFQHFARYGTELHAMFKHGDARCPYGAPGDRLWVREAWARTTVCHGTEMVVYREGDNRTDYGGPWKPGIHMFRRDSRITLEVTGVRVERLQDISEADALAEGIVPGYGGFGLADGSHFHAADPRQSYFSLWEAINGPGSVEAAPWVWVVSLRRHHG